MAWRWPWTRTAEPVETRGSGGFTALSMLARAETITGARGAAELTAAVQACVSLWEGALSRADVVGADLLSPRLLALMGRSLALRGEFCGLLDGDRITPASDWDVSTSLGRPRAYRLSLPDVGGGRSVTALAPEVVHVVIGADVREPWRGVAPLRRASLTADVLAIVEAALGEVFGDAPLGSQVVPFPESALEDQERLAQGFRAKRGRVLLRESVMTTAAGGPQPQTDWRPQGLSPSLRDTMLIEAWDRARDAICQVFGVDPSLLSAVASGPGLREAQRHLATWTLQPIAGLIAQEVGDKLGGDVALDLIRPLGAVDHGGRARALATLLGGIAQAKAAGLSQAEIDGALRVVDLHGLTEE
jgi:hypothetical protein